MEMPLFFKIQTIFWISILISMIPFFFIYRFWLFLRDPQRKIPEGNNIVAPADGFILYVNKIKKKKEMPFSIKKGEKIYLKELMDDHETDYDLVIGIFMTPFSVHHNRFPFSGKIKKNFHRSTKENKSMLRAFLNLVFDLNPITEGLDYLRENERNTLSITSEKIDGAVVQIATKWIDTIHNKKIKIGSNCTKGERFGMIRMGSQCDLFLKIRGRYKIAVKEREYVQAGKSILVELNSTKNHR